MKEENMKPENTRTIHRVINVFGAQNQKMQALEELMELQSALFENVHRETDNRKNIVEEVADVEIMLAQIKEIFDIKPKEIEEIQLRSWLDGYNYAKQIDEQEFNDRYILVMRGYEITIMKPRKEDEKR